MPVGESPHYCLGLEIAGADDKADFEKFKGLEKGFSQCYSSVPGRGRWPSNYPQVGMNFRTWVQRAARHPKYLGQTCPDDSQVYSKGQCFSYLYASKICLLVKYMRENEDIDQFEWTFTGGCFKNSQPVLYKEAVPDTTYDFKDLQIEIRMDHRTTEEYMLQLEEAGKTELAAI